MADRDDAWNGLMRTSVGGNAQLCLNMCSCYSIATKCFKVLYLVCYLIHEVSIITGSHALCMYDIFKHTFVHFQ